MVCVPNHIFGFFIKFDYSINLISDIAGVADISIIDNQVITVTWWFSAGYTSYPSSFNRYGVDSF